MTAMTAFDDVLAANADYAASFVDTGLQGRAVKGLAVVTCMDSRIDPLAMLGLEKGDAKILRNAGGRVTHDVLRTLSLAVHLLGVERVMVVEHSDCGVTKVTEDQVHQLIAEDTGIDTRSLDFELIDDQLATVARDVQKIRSWPFLPKSVAVAGYVYDVRTGRLDPVC